MVGPHPILIAIECRDHSRPADVQWIEQLFGKYKMDFGVSKVLAVSRSGFTRTAIVKAAHVGIGTITLEEAINSELIPIEQRRTILFEHLRPDPPEMDIVLFKEDVDRYGPYVGDPRLAEVLDCKDNVVGTSIDIMKWHTLRHDAEHKTYATLQEGPMPTLTPPLPKGVRIVGENDEKYRLHRMEIKRNAKIKTTQVELQAFRYLTIDLLYGQATFRAVKVCLLILYKDADERRIAWWLEGLAGPAKFELTFG